MERIRGEIPMRRRRSKSGEERARGILETKVKVGYVQRTTIKCTGYLALCYIPLRVSKASLHAPNHMADSG